MKKRTAPTTSIDRSYKELKLSPELFIFAFRWVLIVPLRNWNEGYVAKLEIRYLCIDRSYKELKLDCVRYIRKYYRVLIVSIRNWNMIKNSILILLKKCIDRSYKELKQFLLFLFIFDSSEPWLVLIVPIRNWNIAVYCDRNLASWQGHVLIVPIRNWNPSFSRY